MLRVSSKFGELPYALRNSRGIGKGKTEIEPKATLQFLAVVSKSGKCVHIVTLFRKRLIFIAKVVDVTVTINEKRKTFTVHSANHI